MGIFMMNFVVERSFKDSDGPFTTVKKSLNVVAATQKDGCWTSATMQENAMVLLCNSPCCYYDDHTNVTPEPNGSCTRTQYPMCAPPQ